MTQTTNGKRQTNEKRVHRLQDQLQQLDPQTPFYARERDLLTRELQLMKAQTPRTRSTGQQKAAGTGAKKNAPAGKKNASGKKRTASSKAITKSTPSDSVGHGLGDMLSPKNFKESMNTISTLRGWSKQVAKYVHQADNLLDTLFITANSLQESGVLKKLSETKGKNLSTGDLTSILMALMNSPLGNTVFKKLGGNDSASDESKSADSSEITPVSETPAPALPAPSANTTQQSATQVSRVPYPPQGFPYGAPPGSGSPVAPPPYGMPPNGRPM
ncbi:MAG: hypothetical protein OWR52_10915 [Acidibacillus sp.]|uniref:Uncharacterized protein n=1 Tax=Sulfoacidibacillus ferrooxidans TaxID=2005001 RepID=A0A9X1V8X0_9BACL|nr:hypothetical protein [Sulfoacidibacillus ferrooxidans]MCI0183317.1 hypothetical protein [Sulfoacidibacillus ferrooxidans]MCY0894004.1 hypothetical protein [Acidibacillus sp.]